jgi:hypothetical protein
LTKKPWLVDLDRLQHQRNRATGSSPEAYSNDNNHGSAKRQGQKSKQEEERRCKEEE